MPSYIPMVLVACMTAMGVDVGEIEVPQHVRGLVLSKYESRARPEDPISKRYPWLLETTIEDAATPHPCNGWIVRAKVPTKWAPPYYDDNHHNEYWGIAGDRQYYLGRGDFFELDQDIKVAALRYFLADACIGRLDEESVATIYLQLYLGGRFPFRAAGLRTPRCWNWIRDVREVQMNWRADVLDFGSVPPKSDVQNGRFVGCVLAKVGEEHDDVGCWVFRFESDGLAGVEVTYRKQSTPGFASDRHSE